MMNYPNLVNCILLILLAIAFSSRGYIDVICDLYIWGLGLYYAFQINISKIKINKFLLFSFLLIIFYFSLNIWIGGGSDFKIYYYYSILIPFYFILGDFIRARFFILSLALILGFTSLLTLAHLLGFNYFDFLFYIRDGGVRASGLMVNPNYFAYMCFICFLLFNLLFKSSFCRNILLVLLGLLIVLSFSRGVSAALVVFLFIRVFNIKRLLYSIALFCFFILFMKFSKFDLDGLYSTFEYRIENLKSGDVSGRSDVWVLGFQEWIKSIKDFLFGFGFNNFHSKLSFYNIENTIHNSYLRMLYEFGVFGFIIIMFFYISFFVKIVKGGWYKKAIFLIPIGVAWLSNDFFINKDTFIFMIIFWAYIYYYENKKLWLERS